MGFSRSFTVYFSQFYYPRFIVHGLFFTVYCSRLFTALFFTVYFLHGLPFMVYLSRLIFHGLLFTVYFSLSCSRVFFFHDVGALFLSRFLPLGLLRRFLVRPAGFHVFLRFLAVYRTFDRIAARGEVLVYHSLFAYLYGHGPLAWHCRVFISIVGSAFF